jgi:hypothetical protein
MGGVSNNDTADITFTATTVSAKLVLHAPAGTMLSIQLEQGPICFPTKNVLIRVPTGQSSVTTTVSDTRGVFPVRSTGAFVFVTNASSRQLEICPLVRVP